MEISGNWLDPEAKQQLDDWRELHAQTFQGFLEDASLAPGNFRTSGEFLYVWPDMIRRIQEMKIPDPDSDGFPTPPWKTA